MKLKAGVEIDHKKKSYVGEIPDVIFDEIYAGDGGPEAKKRLDRAKKKYKWVQPKSEKVDESKD